MHHYKRIFVAIDFSPASDEALRQAHQRAITTEAKLAVCHVVPNELRSNVLFPHITRIAALKFPLELSQASKAVMARVHEITGRAEGGFDLIMDDGTPQALILQHAEEWKADLIVVGSHGQTSATDELLGSVTNSILRHAHCAVLVVRTGNFSGGVIAGTDFSEHAMTALKAAGDEAERTHAKVTLVHSLDLIWSAASYPAMAFGGAPFEFSPDHIEELKVTATTELQATLKKAHVNGETFVTTGAAGAALIELASETKAALIVVGTIGRTGLRRALLGSVAETVAQGAPCSVLIVRPH